MRNVYLNIIACARQIHLFSTSAIVCGFTSYCAIKKNRLECIQEKSKHKNSLSFHLCLHYHHLMGFYGFFYIVFVWILRFKEIKYKREEKCIKTRIKKGSSFHAIANSLWIFCAKQRTNLVYLVERSSANNWFVFLCSGVISSSILWLYF